MAAADVRAALDTGILEGVNVLEVGGRAAAICGRLFGELGAEVTAAHLDATRAPAFPAEWPVFDATKRIVQLASAGAESRAALDALFEAADIVVLDLAPRDLAAWGLDPEVLRAAHPDTVIVAITPFGLTGPHRDYEASDLVTFHASGIARLLIGAVEDVEAEPPVRAWGEQADYIAGLTAACAGMHALYGREQGGAGVLIDVSQQEALALMAPRELAMPGFGGRMAARSGAVRGGGAVISVLPASDGTVAVSPRETHQWARWLEVLGQPAWGRDERFRTRADRTAHFDELYDLMAAWSRERPVDFIVEACREAHVPCFAFGEASAMFELPQLEHRGFFVRRGNGEGPMILRPPFGSDVGAPPPSPALEARPPSMPRPAARLPLEGVRVLDLSWVIAGPTTTRYLALMGADVVKVEAPGRPDTGRASELHDVLGESKRAMLLDLKAPGALEAMRRMVARSDVVVENYATGVMERLGLGYEALRAIRDDVVLVSASGLGRTGPEAKRVAYGNLLSAFSGFALLNGHAGGWPRTGLAWADPLCGLLLAFGTVAALRRRDRGGGGSHLDFSMLEALLWTMPRALIASGQPGPAPRPEGNDDPRFAPHGVYRCTGEDRWLAIAVTTDQAWRALCGRVPALASMTGLDEVARRVARPAIDAALGGWASARDAVEAMHELQAAGVAASATMDTTDLFADAHLWERGFYRLVEEADGIERFLPGLPWRWGDGSLPQPRVAPGVGEHTVEVLAEWAGLDAREVEALRAAGAFGTEGGS